MAQEGRRLAAIMFTDIEGYTAITQASEPRAMAILDAHNAILRPYFPEFNGREVKTIGDSFLVEFGSALDAVRCAVEIQKRLHGYNQAATEQGKIRVRIGIHLGDVIHRDGDVFGDAVNISSRIQPLAETGGVCVSQQVFDQVGNKFDLPLVSIGRKTLKNVAGESEVYRVVMPWENSREEVGQLDPRRIAVLPFVSLSPDPNDEYFADGLTEELITKVSFVKGLEVIARTSAMNYKKKEKNAAEIGRELRVGTLLEGSVRKSGNRIRVTAQLIDANTEGHLWAESYDRTLDDVFEVQSSVAQHVAGALSLRLVEKGEKKAEENVSPEVYTIYLRAMHHLAELTPPDLRKAKALFEEAISMDPSYSRAYAGLTNVLWSLAPYEADFQVLIDDGEAAAKKAVELSPDSAEAHVAMATIHTALDRFTEARAELKVAVELNPNLATAYDLLGTNYLSFGSTEEGVAAHRKAHSLDPLSIHVANSLGGALRTSMRNVEAIEFFKEMAALHSRSAVPHSGLAAVYIQTGDYARAKEELAMARALDPGERTYELLDGLIAAKTGDRKGAEEAIAKFSALNLIHYDTGLVMIHAALGEVDQAFAILAKQAEHHSWYAFVKTDPMFEPLRGDPRFAEFCRKVGLPA